MTFLDEEDKFIKVHETTGSPLEWVHLNQSRLKSDLITHGGILLRGNPLITKEVFPEVLKLLSESGELMDYRGGTSPRKKVTAEAFNSTSAPKPSKIALHQEMAYAPEWPLKIAFYCETPPQSMGETPLANMRRVSATLSGAVTEKFKKKRIKYYRNIVRPLGQKWEEFFLTDSRPLVEKFCVDHKIGFKWLPFNSLSTWRDGQTFALHPQTQENLWFNQVIGANWYSPRLFKVAPQLKDLAPGIPGLVLFASSILPANWLPYGAEFMDGPISHEMLFEIDHAFKKSERAFAWKKNDLLILDNMLTAHGRNPFEGPREILVSMADPHDAEK